MEDLKEYMFVIDDYEEQREYVEQDYLNLLAKIRFINDEQELISIDEINCYQNDEYFNYAYDSDGFIYKLHKNIKKAERIDCLFIIKNTRKEVSGDD